ncbi:MAG: CopL family metal-binding regulatory protein [Lysobacter sp.]
MRCLLIAALCLDVGMAQWTASAMAVTEAQQSPDPHRSASAENAEDCDDSASQGSSDTSSHDGKCDPGSACCNACVFPVAAIIHAVPFGAKHLLVNQPSPRSVHLIAERDNGRVFRPPIG